MTPPLEATATADAAGQSPVERILAKGRWKATLAMLGPAFLAVGFPPLQRHGYRRSELALTALLGLIFLGFLYVALRIGPSTSETAHGLIPHRSGDGSLYLAVGLIGATVMPHAIYLHSP